MLADKVDFRYETPYNGLFEITKCWVNHKFTLKCGATKNRHNIHLILMLVMLSLKTDATTPH